METLSAWKTVIGEIADLLRRVYGCRNPTCLSLKIQQLSPPRPTAYQHAEMFESPFFLRELEPELLLGYYGMHEISDGIVMKMEDHATA